MNHDRFPRPHHQANPAGTPSTMKKSLLAIGLVIVAAHVAVIGYFMYRNRQQPPPEPPPASEPAGNTPDVAAPADPADLGPGARPRSPSLGKPFNYQGAVFGDIPTVPGCNLATAGIAVDLDSRQVLWAKNPRQPVPIASMTKMMTALIAFEDIDALAEVDYETMVQVTPAAMKIGGSQVYLDVREAFPLGELLKTIMISSANDSSHLIAEFLGHGDVHGFVRRMNQRAARLRLAGARFHNPHGLPGASAAEDNVGSSEAMVILAEHLLDRPDAVAWASTRIDFFRKDSPKPFQLTNHNRLVGDCPGVNGMKTGFIQRSGFCTTITCERGGRRIACCVTGFPSRKDRDDFVRRLLDWCYGQPAVAPIPMPRETDVIPK
jgi:D-alanyl-D-alanine carboxypeptidase